MGVSKRSDQVFQLSLTEIAFTIAFILLVLLGYLVMIENSDKKRTEEELAKFQKLDALQQALDQASARLQQELASTGVTNPDEVVSRLVSDASAVFERDRLQLRVKDLEAQVSALAEVRQMVADATKDAGRREVVERVVSALALQLDAENTIEGAIDAASFRLNQRAPSSPPATTAEPMLLTEGHSTPDNIKTSNFKRLSAEETRTQVNRSLRLAAAVDQALQDAGAKPLPVGKEADAVASLVRAAQSLRGLGAAGKGVEEVLSDNANLRGQIANMRKRFDASGRGLDHPACWADPDGNIEYLFSVELRQGLAIVTPAWPERRRQEAEQLPGIAALIAAPASAERFRAASRLILNISKRQDPECRHFVLLNNTIESRREADQARWMVEEFFYKREVRR